MLKRIGIMAMLTLLSASPAFADATTPAVQAMADSDNAFALDLYAQLRGTDGNLFFSPYSIDTALMMVHAGAAGATADEMSRTLKLPDLKPAELTAALSALSGRFSSEKEKGYELHLANAMWGQTGASFLPAYLDQLHKNFSAELNGVDFHQPEAAAKTINDWVAQKTSDRIKNLISAGVLGNSTKLVLTNAIYFKGDWNQQFDPKATHDAPWIDIRPRAANLPDTTSGTTPKNVAMMFQAGNFEFMKEDGLSALQMPYAGDDLAMVVLLPENSGTGLADLEKSLDAKRWNEIVGKLRHEREVEVSFPKFKLETKFELSQTLAKMGMATAFSDQADLSGIDGRRDLVISAVIHQAFVQVDETGTEAAAATAVGIRALAVRQPTVFTADHPFLFAIRDVKTGTILFIGRVIHPAA